MPPMLRFLVSLTVAGAVLAAPAGAVTGDPGAGKRKASPCAACHGKDGISKRADAPSIAGQSEVYLVSALKAYRDGERRNEMMSVMARTLSDEDIADLAAWFASFEIEVKARP